MREGCREGSRRYTHLSARDRLQGLTFWSVVQAESSLQHQQQQQLQMQDDWHSDVLTHALELHEQQLQAQNKRQSAALAELTGQPEQQLRAQQARHLSALNEMSQKHEQQLQERQSAARTQALEQIPAAVDTSSSSSSSPCLAPNSLK